MPTDQQPGYIVTKTIEVGLIYGPSKHDFVVMHEDKVRLLVTDYTNAIEKKRDWIAPLGLFLTLTTTLVTAEFKDKFFSSSLWEALFIVLCFVSAGWFVRGLYLAWNPPTVDKFMEKIKASD